MKPAALLLTMAAGIACTSLLTACGAPPMAPAAARTHTAPRPACPTAAQMDQPELLGRWQAEVAGAEGPIVLELGPHPEWEGNVKGHILRPGSRSTVVGEVSEGQLLLEESLDESRISGQWHGDVVQGSCGREIRGEWTDETAQGDAAPKRFTLRKLSPS